MIGFASAAKMHVPSAADYAAEPNNDKYDIVPYWLVDTTPDTARANLEMGSLAMSISAAPKGSSNDPTTTTISVPILTNMKTLQPGMELLVFKPQKRNQREGQDEVEMSQPKAQKKGRGKGKDKGKGKGKP